MKEQILCISYFDQVIGPSLFYSSEDNLDSDLPDINRILEFNEEEGTFIFAFRKYQTINHLFYIDSRIARGGKELLMITYMIRSAIFKNEIPDVFKYLDSKTPILEEYASKLRNIDGLIEIMHEHKDLGPKKGLLNITSPKFKNEFIKIFNFYFKQLSPHSHLDSPLRSLPTSKKIYIFGPKNSGKTTFLKNLEMIQFLNQRNNDIQTRIYEVVIDNIEILTFNKANKEFECEGKKNFTECAQGLILIFNATEKKFIQEAKEMFKIIDNKRSEMKRETIPILIIGDKIRNKKEFGSKKIKEIFNLTELKKLGMVIRYFPINVLKEDEKIVKAIRWLIKQIV
ncbi:MAG: ADP-ribosylation factor-like protein [Promethearchaeota archaeon]